MRIAWLLVVLLLPVALVLNGCASKDRIRKHSNVSGKTQKRGSLKSARSYVINGVTYYPLSDAIGYNVEGIASWYGNPFHGRKTASGEVYDMHEMTAAHKTLPLQTMVAVTRLDTGKKIVLRVNDRGPFVGDRIIDLSREAAKRLDMIGSGTAHVRVEALVEGTPATPDAPPEPVQPVPDFNSGEFYVQIGAFGLRANAERLRERLQYPVDLVNLVPMVTPDGKTLIRVRIGPFPKMAGVTEVLAEVSAGEFSNAFIVAR